MKEILEFYKDKKVFITGHTGFKGSWLAHLLKQNGSILKGYSNAPNTNPNLFHLLQLDSRIDSCIADIIDFSKLEREILDFAPDFIFHLAAQPLVRYSYQNTVETHQTNIIGTAGLLEACRKLQNKCVIVCITTDKVYKNKEWSHPYRESDELGGYDPYSSSKAAAELIIESYRQSFFTNTNIQVASARAGNVIGGGDWSTDRLIPDIITTLNNNEKVQLRNPSSIRPWQHVLDPLLGYLKLGMLMAVNRHKFDQAWNFGPNNDDAKSVLEVAQIFHKIYGVPFHFDINKAVQPHEAGILKLDISKSNSLLKWKPRFETDLAIKLTANWYKSFFDGVSAVQLVNNDITKLLQTNED